MNVRATKTGVRIDVEVKLRASRTVVLGIKADRLSVALAAAPVDGAANDALERAIAEHFGLPRRDVSLVVGKKSRSKVIELQNLSLDDALARLKSTPSA